MKVRINKGGSVIVAELQRYHGADRNTLTSILYDSFAMQDGLRKLKRPVLEAKQPGCLRDKLRLTTPEIVVIDHKFYVRTNRSGKPLFYAHDVVPEDWDGTCPACGGKDWTPEGMGAACCDCGCVFGS